MVAKKQIVAGQHQSLKANQNPKGKNTVPKAVDDPEHHSIWTGTRYAVIVCVVGLPRAVVTSRERSNGEWQFEWVTTIVCLERAESPLREEVAERPKQLRGSRYGTMVDGGAAERPTILA